MKHKWLAWGILFLAYLGAFAANVGHFWWAYDAGGCQIAASVGYVVVWIWFLRSERRNQKQLQLSLIVGILITAGGVFGLLARILGNGVLTILGLMTAGLTITPLYGLLSLIDDYDWFYLIAAVLGIFWVKTIMGLKRRVQQK